MEPVITTAAVGIAGKFLWDRFVEQGDNAVSDYLKCAERAGKKRRIKAGFLQIITFETPASGHFAMR